MCECGKCRTSSTNRGYKQLKVNGQEREGQLPSEAGTTGRSCRVETRRVGSAVSGRPSRVFGANVIAQSSHTAQHRFLDRTHMHAKQANRAVAGHASHPLPVAMAASVEKPKTCFKQCRKTSFAVLIIVQVCLYPTRSNANPFHPVVAQRPNAAQCTNTLLCNKTPPQILKRAYKVKGCHGPGAHEAWVSRPCGSLQNELKS